MTDARDFVDSVNIELEGLTDEEIDNLEPWLWADTYPNEVIEDNDNGIVVEMMDGSMVEWVNSKRKWFVKHA